jgi:thioredoxin reductase
MRTTGRAPLSETPDSYGAYPRLTGEQIELRDTSARATFPLETSRPGVFAVGDVRSGSIKRMASAVGEGSMAVRLIHEHLHETQEPVLA